MAQTDPIFIVGTERSGSNLLRLILNAHSEITVPHPPHVMSYFAPLERYYGDLGSDRNWRRLTDDVIRHVHRHIYQWPAPLTRAELLAIRPPRDLFDLFAAIYDQHRANTGKLRWCCKSTFMIHYTDRILARYPDAKLIWLVRDPRDVAVSSRDSVFNPYHPYHTARLWNQQQKLGLELETRLSPNNLFRCHYEELIQNPEKTIVRLCEFIGVKFEPTMLRFFETEEAKTSASLSREWQNTGRPILGANSSRFRERLSANEIRAIERETRPAMRQLGYAPVSEDGAGGPYFWDLCSYRILNEVARVRVEYRSLRQDRNHRLRWRRAVRMFTLRTRLRMGL
jgi:hypothetical protein